jgi:CubicO group peptidase (beta-lactamase class C family)
MPLPETRAEYIPEFAGEGKEAVLVHHLLTHTSGLRQEDVKQYIDKKYLARAKTSSGAETAPPSLGDYVYLGYDAPLWKAPGVEMSYCNYGYELLGEIVRRVSGKPLADFARERLFDPLGMQDTWYSVPDTVRHRIVRRPATAFLAAPESPGMAETSAYMKLLFAGLNSREGEELPGASSGLYSTAMDMAIMGQMFLNRGRYGDTTVLSPPTVAAMTRNQIPGIGTSMFNEFFPEAGWGFGWDVRGDKKPMYDGTLCSPNTFLHGGASGVYIWVDPVYEIVGVYFSVVLRPTVDGEHLDWSADLFLNAVTAAVSDG